MVLARFAAGSFAFRPPDDYFLPNPKASTFSHQIALVLFCSRTSLVVDPVDWKKGGVQLRKWAEGSGVGIHIPQSPLDYFSMPSARPRAILASMTHDPFLSSMPWIVGGRLKHSLEISHSQLPAEKRGACRELMKIPSPVSAAGIFPKSTVFLFSQLSKEESARVVKEWSLATFLGTYRMWKKRNRLLWASKKNDMKFDGLMQRPCKSPFHLLSSIRSANPFACKCIRVTEPKQNASPAAVDSSELHSRRPRNVQKRKTPGSPLILRRSARVREIKAAAGITSSAKNMEKKITSLRKRKK